MFPFVEGGKTVPLEVSKGKMVPEVSLIGKVELSMDVDEGKIVEEFV